MIKLIKFEDDNKNHLKIIEKLSKDIDVKNNVHNIIYPNDLTYLISNGISIVGMLKIEKLLNNRYTINRAIFKKYRNMHYGTLALEEAIKLLDDDWEKIVVLTSYDNKASINSAIKLGFSPDIKEIERCIAEGVDYYALSLTNNVYQRIKIKK